jgi:hypothetical protein
LVETVIMDGYKGRQATLTELELIVAALAAGVGTGITEITSSAIRDS